MITLKEARRQGKIKPECVDYAAYLWSQGVSFAVLGKTGYILDAGPTRYGWAQDEAEQSAAELDGEVLDLRGEQNEPECGKAYREGEEIWICRRPAEHRDGHGQYGGADPDARAT